MPKSHQLTIFRQHFHGSTFPDRIIAFDVVECLAIQYKVDSADPAVAAFGLFIEFQHLVAFEADSSKTGGGTNSCDGRSPSVGFVKPNETGNIKIRQAITVGEQESFFLCEPFLQSLNPATGLCVQACVYQMDLPVRLSAILKRRFAGGEIEGNVVVQCVKVQKILLHYLLFVSESNHEFVYAMKAERVHDVPENGFPPNLHHWFGPQSGFFGQTGTKSARQNYCLHAQTPTWACLRNSKLKLVP